jgi:uncharacterized membrane protein
VNARRLWFVVACCVALGVFFRAYHLDRKTFWEDEILGTMRMFGYTEAQVVRASPAMTHARDAQVYLQLPADRSSDRLANTLTALAAEDPQHPPGYYLLGHIWAELFGTSLAAIRSLPALLGILALPCVYCLALELFRSRSTAALALALFAVSPVFVLYSQEAREYSFWTLAIALSSITFLRASRGAVPGGWTAYAVTVAAGLYVYPLTALVAAGHGAYLFARAGFRVTRAFAAYLVSCAFAAAVFAPWAVHMLGNTSMGRGLAGIVGGRVGASARLAATLRDLKSPFVDLGYLHGGLAGALNFGLGVACCALALYALYALARDWPFRVWGFVVVALCAPLLPLFAYNGFVYQTRYFMPLLLGLVLAVAALFGAALETPGRPRAVRFAWTPAFVVLATVQVLSCYRSSQAATWWNKDAETSDRVAAAINRAKSPLLVSRHVVPSMLGLAYYLDPGVPLRVDLRCSQCSVRNPERRGLLSDTAKYADVFVLDPPGSVPGGAAYRLIDPRPFPAPGSALSMFQSV